MQFRLLTNLETALRGYIPHFVNDPLHARAMRFKAILEDPELAEKTRIERTRKDVVMRIKQKKPLEESRESLIKKLARMQTNSNQGMLELAMQDETIITQVIKQNKLAQTIRLVTLAKALTLDDVSEEDVQLLCEQLESAKITQDEVSRLLRFLKWKIFGEKTKAVNGSSNSENGNVTSIADHRARKYKLQKSTEEAA